ncbi:hypothetical protein GGX14DRAFT_578779 [Mycena pura]|uniref:Uncharacterized protein n=1 Tax=Mycena pura TaxID=153505 RepID=A0AAD6UQN4_9AGAR|nr:hypothetical protein GGX14DRAFT_578779 [Mycena pura]
MLHTTNPAPTDDIPQHSMASCPLLRRPTSTPSRLRPPVTACNLPVLNVPRSLPPYNFNTTAPVPTCVPIISANWNECKDAWEPGCAARRSRAHTPCVVVHAFLVCTAQQTTKRDWALFSVSHALIPSFTSIDYMAHWLTPHSCIRVAAVLHAELYHCAARRRLRFYAAPVVPPLSLLQWPVAPPHWPAVRVLVPSVSSPRLTALATTKWRAYRSTRRLRRAALLRAVQLAAQPPQHRPLTSYIHPAPSPYSPRPCRRPTHPRHAPTRRRRRVHHRGPPSSPSSAHPTLERFAVFVGGAGDDGYGDSSTPDSASLATPDPAPTARAVPPARDAPSKKEKGLSPASLALLAPGRPRAFAKVWRIPRKPPPPFDEWRRRGLRVAAVRGLGEGRAWSGASRFRARCTKTRAPARGRRARVLASAPRA